MHIGEQLVVYGTSVISLYTPWFARLADNARFTYEILREQGNTLLLEIDFDHKPGIPLHCIV